MLDLLLAPFLIAAAPQQVPCPTTGAEAPIAAAWAKQTPARPAALEAGSAPVLTIGSPATLSLRPTGDVTLIEPPRTVYATDSYAGYAAVDIAEAGDYRVILSGQGWLEILADGKAVRTIGNKGGPRCADIRKTVDLTLSPGRHLIQIHGNLRPEIRLMVQPIS